MDYAIDLFWAEFLQHRIEYSSVCIVIGLLSMFKALTARFSFFDVPWLKLFVIPSYFGGYPGLVRGGLILLAWMTLSVVICLAFTFAALNIDFFVKFIYEAVSQAPENRPKINLGFTAILLAIAFYVYNVNRAQKLVKRKTPNTSADLSAFAAPLNRGGLRSIFDYLAPELLAMVYVYFYNEISEIKQGLANYLYDKYGKDNIISFYKNHKNTRGNDKLKTIDARLTQSDLTEQEKALIILKGKLKIISYAKLVTAIETEIKKRSKEKNYNSDSRQADRKNPRQCPKVHYSDGDTEGKGVIMLCSKNGYGCFFATKKPLNENNSLTLSTGGNSVQAKVVHRNAQVINNKIKSGAGLKSADDQSFFELAVLEEDPA